MKTINQRNIATYLVALLVIVSINFVLPRMMPGDPLMAIYGEEALVAMTPELKAFLLRSFELDQPLWRQFLAYLGQTIQGNLGFSYYHSAPTLDVILGRLPWTLLLVGTALILSTALGVFLGIESGWRRGKLSDRTMLSGLMALSGFPDFFLAMVLLLVFSVLLRLLPLAGSLTPYSGLSGVPLVLDVLRHLILPASALTLGHVAGNYLLTRNTMVTVIKEPFILAARAKGLHNRTIQYRHAGRNALLPVITRTGIWLGRIVTGTLFVEVIFAYPGLGSLTYRALLTRDYAVLQGVLLLVAVLVLVVNFCVDLVYASMDPRIRHAH
jgi:peptide/nickel transport system permease protein